MHPVSAVSTVKSGWGNSDFHNWQTYVDILITVNIESKLSGLYASIISSYIRQHPNCSECVTMVTGYIFQRKMSVKTGNNEEYRHIIWVHSVFRRDVLKDKACGTQLLIQQTFNKSVHAVKRNKLIHDAVTCEVAIVSIKIADLRQKPANTWKHELLFERPAVCNSKWCRLELHYYNTLIHKNNQ